MSKVHHNVGRCDIARDRYHTHHDRSERVVTSQSGLQYAVRQESPQKSNSQQCETVVDESWSDKTSGRRVDGGSQPRKAIASDFFLFCRFGVVLTKDRPIPEGANSNRNNERSDGEVSERTHSDMAKAIDN